MVIFCKRNNKQNANIMDEEYEINAEKSLIILLSSNNNLLMSILIYA